MKKIIIVVAAAVVVISISVMIGIAVFPNSPQTEAVKFAENLGTGWNLGNTLDACQKGSAEKAGLESETHWGNPVTTKEMIDFVKSAGFKTVRIPITWAQHLTGAPDYGINEEWLDRVNEIVDYVLESGMYAIINIHHDDAFWLITDYEHEEKAEDILKKIWEQVSERFKEYDERLVFEVMNEPRVTGVQTEWSGEAAYREVVNNLNSAALETIRSSGGNNAERFVMIPSYAASSAEDNLSALTLPEDEKVLVSVHYYYDTAHSSEFLDCEKKLTFDDKAAIHKTFKRLHKYFLSKGYGVVIGEFGWTDRVNLENLAEKAKFYVKTAEDFGIPCIVWDNGGDFRLLDRRTLQWEYPEYVEAIV